MLTPHTLHQPVRSYRTEQLLQKGPPGRTHYRQARQAADSYVSDKVPDWGCEGLEEE
jgi:hypothetical protein